MAVFELVLALLLGGVSLALLAERLSVPWPALLALAGAALAFVPDIPPVALDPDLALALFVAPILLDAAYDASPRDLRDNWAPLGGLVLVAVGLTVVAVAFTARWLVPEIPWAAAVALGAIVAPPDASAATAVLRQLRLPHRMMVILEGESLLNDASALLIYRSAVVAAASGITAWTVPLLAASAAGGIVLGIVLARMFLAVSARIAQRAAGVVLQFLGTFGVWLLADALHLSAILTLVAYAMTIARIAPSRTRARQRRSTYAVWEFAVFVLSMLAFILVGLQLRAIRGRLDSEFGRYAGFALAVLGVTILVRFVWVMGYNAAVRWKNRRFGARTARPMVLPTAQGGLIVAWCGMRGIVTLAAALALPDGFPQRDLIIFAAFSTVLGTLVLQGMTLRPLAARLDLPPDDSVETEAAMAREKAARAALDALGPEGDGKAGGGKAGRLLREEYKARIADGSRERSDPTGLGSLRRRALAAERNSLIELRREGRIGDDAFHLVEEELDWAEADLDDERGYTGSR